LRRSIFQLRPSTALSGRTGFSSSAHAVEIPNFSPESGKDSTSELNPGSLLDLTYTEWLNGFPMGWIGTSLPCKPSETQRYLESRKQSFEASEKRS